MNIVQDIQYNISNNMNRAKEQTENGLRPGSKSIFISIL